MTGGPPALDALLARAELQKLERLLELESADPVMRALATVDAVSLRALRDATTDRLYDANADAMRRMSGAGRLIPTPILVRLAESVFGAVLCARIAGLFEPRRAAEVAARLSDDFLASVAAAIDPRRASPVIALLPPERFLAVARVLIARGDYVTMGRFVGHLPSVVLPAAIDSLGPEALLRTAFVLDEPERLEEIVDSLPEDRRRAMVEEVAAGGLYDEVAVVLHYLREDQRAALAALAEAILPSDARARLDAEVAGRGVTI